MNIENKIGLLSIGGLAKASGLSVETLRNWERRYGFPSPERRDSGHRRYHWELVARLTKIRRILEQGYKPSFAVNANDDDLDMILLSKHISTEEMPSGPSGKAAVSIGADKELALWQEYVQQMDAQLLTNLLRKAWGTVGARRFLLKMIIPFLQEVGVRWEDGRLTVAHEHFASEVIQTFLSSHWRPLANRGRNGKVILANLAGEFHSLRLHIAAVFLVLHDYEPIFLGPNTPAVDIVSAAKEMGVHSVVVGLAPSSSIKSAKAELEVIQKAISNDVFLIFGGNEQLSNWELSTYIHTFDEFDNWYANHLSQ